MKIYIVNGIHEGNDTIGIFTKHDLAEKCIDKYKRDLDKAKIDGTYMTDYYDYLIEEQEIE